MSDDTIDRDSDGTLCKKGLYTLPQLATPNDPPPDGGSLTLVSSNDEIKKDFEVATEYEQLESELSNMSTEDLLGLIDDLKSQMSDMVPEKHHWSATVEGLDTMMDLCERMYTVHHTMTYDDGLRMDLQTVQKMLLSMRKYCINKMNED